jgi:hypothetical protein
MMTVLGMILTYQNCAQTPDSTSNSASSYASSLPFAYSAQIDTIGYMSCSEIKTAVEPRAYFSFRVGAYDPSTGGLKLTDDFQRATRFYSTQQKAQALAQSDLNKGARLTVSIRSRTNLQQIWYQNSLEVGNEIDSLLPPLDSMDVAGSLAGTGQGVYRNYFPGSGAKRLMEGSLRFYEFENVAKTTRNNLEGSGTPSYLVVGYSTNSDELQTNLRVPAATTGTTQPASVAYGRGYAFTFNLPNGYTNAERRVVSQVREIDLSTGQPPVGNSTWDCSTSYQFEVVRPEDIVAGRVLCNTAPDIATSAQQKQLAAIRRVLRPEDWYVDLNHHCVVPKITGDYCYGTLQTGQAIQYGGTNCTTTTTNLCPHFVSVCVRP